MLTVEQQEGTVALCQALVRCQSYSGNEQAAVQALKSYMESNGFDEVHIDEYGSLLGCIRGKYSGPKILFDGHLDTVPVTNPANWTYDPFGAERVDGKIYGRGTTDMKGAVAAMASAAIYFARETNKEFHGELYVSGVVHEECFEGVGARSISQRLKPDLVVIGEPSSLELKIGQRGRAEIVFETFGVAAHSALPHKGVNAVHLMLQLIQEVEKLQAPYSDELSEGVAVLTDMISTPYPGASVVPNHCKVTYDRRLLVGETKESVLQPYQAIIDQLEKTVPNFKAKVTYSIGEDSCYTGLEIKVDRFFPAWCAKVSDDHVQKAIAGLQQAGVDVKVTYFPFCTNGSHYAGECSIPTIGFGPSYEYLAHVKDEYIEENQLIKATEGYIGICHSFLSK